MERIRIGNNISIVWHIFVADDLGESFVLEDKKDSLKVFLRSPYNITEVKQFGVNGDTINFSFLGDEQKYVGVYAVVLKDTAYGEKTLCEDFAFELVKHLGSEQSETEQNYTKKILALNSSILVSKQGDSAYEVWLRMGNKGTEEDFFNWLRGGTLVNYSFRSPLVCAQNGANYIVSLNQEAISGIFITNGSITEDKLSPSLQQFILNAVSKERLQELFDSVVIGIGRYEQIETDKLILNGHTYDSFANQSTDPKSDSAIVTPSYLKDFGFGSYLSRVEADTAHGLITFEKGFVMGANLFTEAITEAKWSKGTADNQIMTAAAIRRLIKDNLETLPNKYLRKDIEDTAKEIITFQRGLKANLTSYFYAGMYAAGVAIFKDMLSSETFVSGWSPVGKGWKLWVEEYENIAGAPDFKAKMELDELTVRGTFRVVEFVINQLRGENDNYVFAGMMKVDHFEAPDKIWLDTNGGETYNPFRADDILRCQQFRGNTIKQYTLIVEDAVVGSLDEGENRMDYITIKTINSQLKFEGELSDIQKGDILVRLDNLTNPDRKGIVNVDSIGSAAPSLSVSYGTITDPEKSLRVRLGRLDDIVDKTHGSLSGYGLYGNKVYLTGEFNLITGDDVRTQFLVHENLLCSRQTKTTFNLTDKDMLIHNCAFADNLEYWILDEYENDGMYSIDGVPLMHDFGILASNEHEINKQNYLGMEVLHILSSGLTQLQSSFAERIPEDYIVDEYVKDENGEIQLGDDGAPLTKQVTKRNVFHLYISYMCAAAPQEGSAIIRFGFQTGRIYQRQETDGDTTIIPPLETQDDPLDDICFIEETCIPYDDRWIERHYMGYYDGTSDFRIEAEGDFSIGTLIITNRPLDELKNVVTTALLQHDGIIGMYGRSIKKGGEETANLKIEVDANKEIISAIGEWNDKNKTFTLSNGLLIDRNGSKLFSTYLGEQEQKISNLSVGINGISAEVFTLRGGQYELQYQNSVSVRTDPNDVTTSYLQNYYIALTSLFAGEVVSNYSIDIAYTSSYAYSKKYWLSKYGTYGVYVNCKDGVTLTEAVTLEAIVTIQDPDGKREDVTDPSSPIRTYSRSAFIQIVPSKSGKDGEPGKKGDTGETGAGEVYTLVDLGSYAQVNAKTTNNKAALSIYSFLSCAISHTVDGTSQPLSDEFISNHKIHVSYEGSTKINKDITITSGNTTEILLNWVEYTETDENKAIVVSLQTNDNVTISSFVIPLTFSKAGVWNVTEEGINGIVSGEGYSSFSTFVQTAKEIETQVNDARGNSTLKQAFDNIQSTVIMRGNPNLLSCADGNGWFEDYNLQTKASFDISTQKVASRDAYSLKVYLIGGNTYCFSYYGSSASLYLYKGSSYTAFGSATKDTTRETYQGYYLYYKTFAPSGTGMYVINLYGSNPFYRPKLESGTVPTLYDTTVQSSINQTANEIRLTADKITLEGLVTANSNFKILQDGSMEAVNGKFSGELKATSGSITGALDVSGSLVFGSTNKLVFDGATSKIIGYTGSNKSMELGYNNNTYNNFKGTGLYFFREGDDYVSLYRAYDWEIWGSSSGNLSKIRASCNGASELMDFCDSGSRRFTFGISSRSEFYLVLSNVDMLPNRDKAVKGQLFVGNDEVVRIKLKDT